MDEGLELGGEDHVDEDQSQPERERQVPEGAPHLLVLASHLPSDVGGGRQRRQHDLDVFDGLSQPPGYYVGVHRHDAGLVFPSHLGRSQRITHHNQLANRDPPHPEPLECGP